MPPYLSEEGRRTVLPRKLDELLSKRWFPAMDQLCAAVGFSEQQIEDLTNRTIDYFVNGPRGIRRLGSAETISFSSDLQAHGFGRALRKDRHSCRGVMRHLQA
jgi:hypothetical protein